MSNVKFYCVLTLSGLFWLLPANLTHSQTPLVTPLGASRPLVGATHGLSPPAQLPLISGSQDTAARVHLNPARRPCLTVYGYAKQELNNPHIYQHTIFASSDCAQPIKLRICYYHTQQCVPMVVPAYARKQTILAIMPQMKQFRFEYWEQFDNTPSGLAGTGYR